MKDSWLRSIKRKCGFNFKILFLLGALALAVMVGLGTAPRAASDKTNNKTDEILSNQMGSFDPFTLSNITPVMEESSSTEILTESETRPSILIPMRPATRGSFRPLVHP
jgi:hypothetical protein